MTLCKKYKFYGATQVFLLDCTSLAAVPHLSMKLVYVEPSEIYKIHRDHFYKETVYLPIQNQNMYGNARYFFCAQRMDIPRVVIIHGEYLGREMRSKGSNKF